MLPHVAAGGRNRDLCGEMHRFAGLWVSGRCGPGCKCTGCKNVVSNVVSEDGNIHHSNPESEESGSDEDSDDDADEDANDGTVQHGEPLDEHTPQPALVDTTTPAEIEEEHMEP